MTATKSKTICLVTNWYPTKDNPYLGSFFKEQAFALSGKYSFVVLHYSENRALFSSHRINVDVVNEEQNTVEYAVNVKLSVVYDIFNLVSDFIYRFRGHRTRVGIGKRVSKVYINHKKKVLKQLIDNGFPKFDALYCVDAQYEAGTIRVLSEITDKPYIVSEHSPVPPPGLLINNYNYLAIENADAFLAISYDKIRQLLMQGIHLPQIFYVGNMIDEDKYTLVDTRGEAIKTILTIGANSFYKNYEMFCKVMNMLCDITEIQFKIIVAGYAANKGYSVDIDGFEKMMENQPFADRLEMISSINREDMPALYAKADVFVMSSLQEGQPLAALEAACCGLPIYSTRCGGIEDYVDEKVGRVYNITDYEGMAEGLKLFVEGQTVFDSVYIRNKVISLYGRKAFVKGFTDAFESVLRV